MTRYICTVGTSASQHPMQQPDVLEHLGGEHPRRLDSAAVEALGGEEKAVAVLRPAFLALDPGDDETLRRRLSAEVHSLVRLGLGADDDVELLATDTPDGCVCARLVKEYLEHHLAPHAVTIHHIKGLQVDNAHRFRTEGIREYIQTVRRLGDERAWTNVVLNPTGGYKALIPYTTLLGMIHAVRVCYIFDNGRELIDLPPLPVDFNFSQLATLRETLERLEEQVELTEDDFWGRASHEEREALSALVEPSDRPGWVTLSGIGLIALERLRAAADNAPVRVLFSLRAWEDYCQAPAEWGLETQMETLRKSTRGQIDARIDKKKDGSRWFKPGRTADRWRVEWEGDDLLVYRILEHDEYEKALGHARWDRADYAPFVPYDPAYRP